MFAKFKTIWFWISFPGFLLGIFVLVQDRHNSGGTSTVTYERPSLPAARYNIVRVDNTKPEVKKLEWNSATTATAGKWTIRIDNGETQKFDSLEELNDELDDYGIELRELPWLAARWKGVKEAFSGLF